MVCVRQQLGASERTACRVLGQPRTTQRRARKVASEEEALRGDIVRLASRFGRYGYRRVTDMLRIAGWGVNHKRVERDLEAGGAEGHRSGSRSEVGCGSTTDRASG